MGKKDSYPGTLQGALDVAKAYGKSHENIEKAIAIFGPDFKVPRHDDEFPETNRELFQGCGFWFLVNE